MNTEELLKPRYKMIADYPNSTYKVGNIFHQETDATYLAFLQPDKYPHLFRKMEWWEEREEKDLPKYVKSLIDQKYYKVITSNPVSFRGFKEGELIIDYPWDNALPATAEEYNQFLEGNNTQ